MKFAILLLLLPFYIPACILSFIAGMIGGKHWHVTLNLEEHQKGTPLVSLRVQLDSVEKVEKS